MSPHFIIMVINFLYKGIQKLINQFEKIEQHSSTKVLHWQKTKTIRSAIMLEKKDNSRVQNKLGFLLRIIRFFTCSV